MFKIILSTLITISLNASMNSLITNVKGDEAKINIDKIEIGVSGYVVRHLNKQHSTIIANAEVINFDSETKTATIKTSEYTGLRQFALPSGNFKVSVDDQVILASDYSRATLLAPSENIYRLITSKIRGVQWIESDMLATFISYEGHPTPIKKDITNYCSTLNSGLLYIYTYETLFTLDCRSMVVLQTTPAPIKTEEIKLPFFSYVDKIREAWWGEGSSPLESYEPYYMDLIVENNTNNPKLYNYIKEKNINSEKYLKEFNKELQK